MQYLHKGVHCSFEYSTLYSSGHLTKVLTRDGAQSFVVIYINKLYANLPLRIGRFGTVDCWPSIGASQPLGQLHALISQLTELAEDGPEGLCCLALGLCQLLIWRYHK